MNEVQVNYIVIEKAALVGVFGFKKFTPYLIGSHVIFLTDHTTLKHLFEENDAQPRRTRWIMLLHEFDCKIKD